MLDGKLEPLLVQFYIFNPRFGLKEGEEHKKLLFYYPPSDSIDVQVRSIGFCEAIIKFSSSFSERQSATHSVTTDKQLHFYYQPEGDYLMGMVLSKEKAKEMGETLHEDACSGLLQISYKMFRLFFGTFEHNYGLVKQDLDALRQRLATFYDRDVVNMRFSKVALLDIVQGVNFMPLDTTNYLLLQATINRFKEAFPCVKHTVFMYNNRLLWSSIPLDDMCVLYRYLAYKLLPSFVRSELQPSASRNLSTGGVASHHYGKFVTGPPDLDNPADLGRVPRIFIHSSPYTAGDVKDSPIIASSDESNSSVSQEGEKLEEYQLVIYRALNATLCVLIETSFYMDLSFYRNVDNTLGPDVTTLASNMGEFYEKMPVDSQHHYVYFNAQTRSMRTTFDPDSTPGPLKQMLPSLSAQVLNSLCDLRHDLQRSDYFGDIIAKSEADVWLAAKKSGERELYVVINQKNANMTEVTEEVKKLCTTHFSNMFLNE